MLKVQELNVFSYERNRSVFHLPFFFFPEKCVGSGERNVFAIHVGFFQMFCSRLY